MIISVLTYEQFNQTVDFSYIDVEENDGFNVPVETAVPAVQISIDGTFSNITNYWNAMFYVDTEKRRYYYRAVSCNEKFSDDYEILEQFDEETNFLKSSTGWLCPNIEYMNVQEK